TVLPIPPIPIPPIWGLFTPRSLQPVVIPLALGAELVDELRIGLELLREGDCEWLRVDLRIVDRDLNLERPEIRTSDLLRHLRDIAHRAAPRVNPQIVAEAPGLDDERVAFPMPDRIAVPRGVHVLGERPAVEKDLPVHRVHLVHEYEQLRRVDGLREMRER